MFFELHAEDSKANRRHDSTESLLFRADKVIGDSNIA